jgi:nucleoside-diphosphate-sugar epimerase
MKGEVRMNILLIGGTGTISTNTLNALTRRGESVALLNRGITTTETREMKTYHGDRNNAELLSAVIDDFRPDVVIDFVCFHPEQAQHLVRTAKGKIGHYVFVSTVDVYGYPLRELPMKEDTHFNQVVSVYARNKLLCEAVFTKAHDLSEFPITIVRPLYSLGPKFLISMFSHDGANVVRRMKARRPIIVPGDGTTTVQPSLAINTGEMIAAIAGRSVAFGQSYNVGDERVMSHDDYYRAIGKAIGVEPNLVHVPTELLLRSKEIRNSLLPELTRFNLQYSLKKFELHFSEFQPSDAFIEGIRSFTERVSKDLDNSQGNQLEDEIAHAWTRVSRNFRIEHMSE